MITLRLYLETIAGDCYGWVEGFPGAFVSGSTAKEVERSAPRAFTEYILWLRLNGEPVLDGFNGLTSADFSPRLEQVVAEVAGGPCEARHRMNSDLSTLEPADFERCLRILGYSRADLIDAAGAFPPHEWDTAPPGAHSVRSALLQHADVELSMLGKIGFEPTVRMHPDPLTTLSRIRSTFEATVRESFERPTSSQAQPDDSAWTLAKVLRMTIWHERMTTRQIAVRSNPRAYLRSVTGSEAVVRHRDTSERSDGLTTSVEESAPAARHTQTSGYYY